MPTTTINIRTDSEVKAQAQVVLSKLGLDLTTAVNLFLRQVICKESVSFDVSVAPLKKAAKLAVSGASLAKELRRQGKRIVFTNGCFDLVHAGHIKSFEQAKSLGDVLIVGLNSDRSVRTIKGHARPVISQNDRAKLLCALFCVDYVIIFDEETPERLIEEILPDVLVKGADWRGKAIAGQEAVEANGGRVEFIELEQGLSTTNIVERIRLF